MWEILYYFSKLLQPYTISFFINYSNSAIEEGIKFLYIRTSLQEKEKSISTSWFFLFFYSKLLWFIKGFCFLFEPTFSRRNKILRPLNVHSNPPPEKNKNRRILHLILLLFFLFKTPPYERFPSLFLNSYWLYIWTCL